MNHPNRSQLGDTCHRRQSVLGRKQNSRKRIIQSVALMLYLYERYDKGHPISFPSDTDEYWVIVEWLDAERFRIHAGTF